MQVVAAPAPISVPLEVAAMPDPARLKAAWMALDPRTDDLPEAPATRGGSEGEKRWTKR